MAARFALEAALAVALTCATAVRCSLLLEEARNLTAGSCRPEERCAARRQPIDEHPADIPLTKFVFYPCFCDENCHVFKDCCHDELENSSSARFEDGDRIYGLPWSVWGCQNFTSIKQNSAWMVSRCPEHSDPELASQCATTAPDRTYIHDLPVIAAGVLFKNIFCASCFDMTYNDLYPLNLEMACEGKNVTSEDLIDATYKPGELTFQLSDESICKLEINQFHNMSALSKDLVLNGFPPIRQCRQVIDYCPETWKDAQVAEKCAGYWMIVQELNRRSINSRTFKNPHCALCNNATVMNCGALMMRTHTSPTFRAPIGSLSLIFHFSFGGGNVVGREACAKGYVWDNVYQKCQLIYSCESKNFKSALCPSDELNEEVSVDFLGNSSTLNCSKVVLEQVDYTLMQNGSLFINATRKIVHAEDFIPLSDERVEICVDEGDEILPMETGGETSFSEWQSLLTLICTVVSLIGLSLHILVLLAVPKLRNLPGMISMGISVSLLMAQLLFLIATSPSRPADYGGCVALAAILHFSFLSVFAWTAIMSFDIWRTFSHPTGHIPGRKSQTWRVQFTKYCVFASAIPLVIVAIAIGVDQCGLELAMSPQYGLSTACWFGSRLGLGIFFALPVSLILIFNLCLYTLVVLRIKEQKKATKYIEERQSSRRARYTENDCKLHFSIFNVMGGTWILGLIAGLVDHPILWTIYIIMSGSQGAIIFVLQIMKRRVLHMIRNRLAGKEDTVTNTSGSGSRTTSALLNRSSERSSGNNTFIEGPILMKSRVE
ncbi:uncharacterized protein LOC132197488 isoform X2 [Neocloeon triangulifer]|uniref:uncharacterized protein LOC132197488 isoform X2 n=1 Tax=Neocloeon triangulifer TaxID=2078957 RepID=UPI00286F2490|nr:uncharacterized protein LOC132197488 isoform X2 [Neocloeon triangulifer]